MAFLWDILAWLLVIFPLFTGGVWFKRPGIYFELSELGIPVLITTSLALLVFWKNPSRIQQTTAYRFGSKIWNYWKSHLTENPRAALAVAYFLNSAIWTYASLRRHAALQSGASELGVFTSAIWNLTHGFGYVSSVKSGINLFFDHQSPLFWLLAPVFRGIPYPETLLVLQAFGLCTGGLAVYYLVRQYTLKTQSTWIPALAPWLYWAYLPIRNANAFDFHPEVFMLPLFLWAIVGLQSEKMRAKWLGALAFVLALGAKESAGPVAFGMGLSWLFGAGPAATRHFTRRVAILFMTLGLGAFYLDTRLVPQWLGTEYAYNSNYAYLGNSLLRAPFEHPKEFWGSLLGLSRIKFLFWTLAPLGFLPLLGWRALISALPGYMMLFLSEGNHRVDLNYHYAIEPAVGIFWALTLAMPLALSLSAKNKASYNYQGDYKGTHSWIFTWTVFWALACFGRSDFYRIRVHSPSVHVRWVKSELIPCLNPDHSFSVSSALVPQLARRHWIHYIPQYELPSHEPVNCVLFDPELNNWPMTETDINEMPKKMAKLGLTSTYQCRGLVLYERNDASNSCLSCQPKCEP